MTLEEFFQVISENPAFILFFFVALPLTAFLASVFGKGEGHLTPWKQLYCFLAFAAAIPGIFAVMLNVYLFLFEKQPIMQTDIYTQILPILIMVITFWLINRNVPFELIPGFDKLTGLIMLVVAVLSLMWFLDRLRIIAFTYMPFHYVLIFLVAAFIGIRFGAKKMFTGKKAEA